MSKTALSGKETVNKFKRHKIPLACNNCRNKKIKCSGAEICDKCQKLNVPCVYTNERKYVIKSTPSKNEKKDYRISKKRYQNSISEANLDAELISAMNKKESFPIIESVIPLNQSSKNISMYKNLPAAEANVSSYEQKNFSNIEIQENSLSNQSAGYISKSSATSFQANGLTEFPPKDTALDYMRTTWNTACISFRFYHRPTVYKILESIYEMKENGVDINDLANFNFEQKKALPLFYLIFGCGLLFINEQKAMESNNISEFFFKNEQFENVGLDYFESGKKLLDFINSTDNRTIQTLFMMSLYCQFTARLPESYTYNSLAITAMLKRGYYKKQIGHTTLYKDPLQGEVIKRMFWSCYKTEIYMSTILGYPIKLKLKDITQDFPIDTEDENISNTHITLNTGDELISSCGINNFHTKLMLIMYEIKEHFQDLANQQIRENKTEFVALTPSPDFVDKIESSLTEWINTLPDYLKPSTRSNFIPDSFLKVNKLLNLDYLSIKLMLYKPFTQVEFIEKESFYQRICVDICVEVIHLAEMMWNKEILNGSYWFSQYTIFFALALLSSWKLKCGNNFDDILELNRNHGLRLLQKLKECSVTSMFIYNELTKLFNLENSSISSFVQEDAVGSPFDQVTSGSETLPAFSNNQETALFDGMPFFEATADTPFPANQLFPNSIFDQFNDLFQ